MDKYKFVRCDCAADGLLFTFDDETRTVDITPYSYPTYAKLSFFERLRHAFRVLWIGFPYSDCVTIGFDETRELGKYIAERTNQLLPNM